MGYC